MKNKGGYKYSEIGGSQSKTMQIHDYVMIGYKNNILKYCI